MWFSKKNTLPTAELVYSRIANGSSIYIRCRMAREAGLRAICDWRWSFNVRKGVVERSKWQQFISWWNPVTGLRGTWLKIWIDQILRSLGILSLGRQSINCGSSITKSTTHLMLLLINVDEEFVHDSQSINSTLDGLFYGS